MQLLAIWSELTCGNMHDDKHEPQIPGYEQIKTRVLVMSEVITSSGIKSPRHYIKLRVFICIYIVCFCPMGQAMYNGVNAQHLNIIGALEFKDQAIK